ncbi:hypothetical protein Ahy_A07g034821 [Arachis hypogaea]|uniref:Protein FAR1-RELATED SEQUENCE n=1 Tax=Arachis hypogaea TaxID=3818 RepID=A0A445CCR7_ARAHY|nr:hypothetical protein Ahy_A07g034821 [Arachis hypogaea]
MQLKFTDEEAVYRFYKTYVMMHGFTVRLVELRRDSDGCAQERKRLKRMKELGTTDLTRSCCQVRIRARLDRKIHKWKVVSFYEEHSHGLVDPLDVSMMPKYRTFSVSDKVMWGDMVARYNLSSNSWVDQTYELRNLWALAYLRDQFFGQIRTTSQCEGIKSLIKAYVRKKDTLLEFINNIETFVSHYRNNERVAEFNSKYTDPVLVTSSPTLEDFAAKTFTHNMFQEVRKEIEGACAMNTELVIQDGGKLYFKCNSFGVPEIDHVVEFDRVGGMLCECLWFENRGIPCMHIFACLKHQHVEVIPECLVCKRWTKNAKSDFMKSSVDDPSDFDKVLKCRLGVLGAECSRLMDVSCKNSSDFVKAMNDVVNTITKLQKRGENPHNDNLDNDYIVDPLVVKSKGTPKKNSKFNQRRRCSNCGVIGHYNKSCPNVPGRIPKEPVDDDTEKNISSHLDILTKVSHTITMFRMSLYGDSAYCVLDLQTMLFLCFCNGR